MTTLSNAIKVSIQATKEASSSGGMHTDLLNNIAARLGFKDFRALVESEKDSGSKPEIKAPARNFDFEPFEIHAYSNDEMISSVCLEVTGAMLEKMFELSGAAQAINVDIFYPDRHETKPMPRHILAVRPLLSPNGEVRLEAELADKHMCTTMSVYGSASIDAIYALAHGNTEDHAQVTVDYIWDDETRRLYLVGDAVEPSCWIEEDSDNITELLDEYEALS